MGTYWVRVGYGLFLVLYGYVLGMSWVCSDYVLGMIRVCTQNVLGMFWVCFGYDMKQVLSRYYPGIKRGTT